MSVANDLRADQQRTLSQLSVSQRIELAFKLGQRDVQLYAATHQLSFTDARERMADQRNTGRAGKCNLSR